MKAIQVNTFGGPGVLGLTTLPQPTVTRDQVLIQVEAIGVGFVDILFRTGQYPGVNTPGFIPGVEVAGTVIETGPGVSADLVGAKVFVITPLGGYADHVVAAAENLVMIPPAISAHQAVSLGVNALVAFFSLARTQLAAGDALLVRGAGGGIGNLVVQIGLSRELNISAETGKAAKALKLKEWGASLFDQATEVPAEGVFAAVIDPVAGTGIDLYVNLLKPNGRYVFNGAAGGFPAPDFGMSWLTRFQRSLSMICLSLNSFSPNEIRTAMSAIFELTEKRSITPLTAHIFPLAEAAAAHSLLGSGEA